MTKITQLGSRPSPGPVLKYLGTPLSSCISLLTAKMWQKGEVMRQLHIKEPWADLAYNNDKQILQDLVSRIQILEARIRELELRISQSEEIEREAVPV